MGSDVMGLQGTNITRRGKAEGNAGEQFEGRDRKGVREGVKRRAAK